MVVTPACMDHHWIDRPWSHPLCIQILVSVVLACVIRALTILPHSSPYSSSHRSARPVERSCGGTLGSRPLFSQLESSATLRPNNVCAVFLRRFAEAAKQPPDPLPHLIPGVPTWTGLSRTTFDPALCFPLLKNRRLEAVIVKNRRLVAVIGQPLAITGRSPSVERRPPLLNSRRCCPPRRTSCPEGPHCRSVCLLRRADPPAPAPRARLRPPRARRPVC